MTVLIYSIVIQLSYQPGFAFTPKILIALRANKFVPIINVHESI